MRLGSSQCVMLFIYLFKFSVVFSRKSVMSLTLIILQMDGARNAPAPPAVDAFIEASCSSPPRKVRFSTNLGGMENYQL